MRSNTLPPNENCSRAAQLLILGHGPKSCRVSMGAQKKLSIDGIVDFAALSDGSTAIAEKDRIDLLVESGEDKPVRLPAIITDIENGKILVLCPDIQDEKLRQVFDSGKGANDGPANYDRTELFTAIKRVTSSHLRIIVDEFLRLVQEDIFQKTQSAPNDKAQAAYFEALSQIKSYESLIVRRFQQPVLEQLDRCDGLSAILQEQNADTGFQGLSVIEKNAFEDWLIVKRIIVSATQKYHVNFAYILERYSEVMGVELSEDYVPVGINYLCRALQYALDELMHDRQIMAIICNCFEKVVLDLLGNFYDELNAVFRDSNVLPSLEEDSANGLRPKERLRSHLINTDSFQTEPDVGAVEEDSQLSYRVPYDKQPLTQEDTARLYNTVKSIFNLRRSEQVATPGYVQGPVIPDQQVLETLSQLQSQQQLVSPMDADVSMRHWLQEEVAKCGGQGNLGDHVMDRVDLVEGIFNSIVNDDGVSDVAKPHLRQLSLPFLRVVLSDDQFLEDKNHPGRELLNQLAVLSSYSDMSPASIERKLESITQKITQEQDPGTEVLSGLLEEVNKWVGSQQSAHTRNAQRVANTFAGQEELAQAKDLVRKELAKRLMGIKVPQVVLSLLASGWRDLLVIVMIKSGVNSQQFHEGLRVIDQLLSWLALEQDAPAQLSNEDCMDRDLEAETFVQSIDGALESGFPGDFKHVNVINDLRRILSEQSINKDVIDYVELETNDPLYGFSMPAKKVRRQEVEEMLHRWIERAKALEVGCWLGDVQAGDRTVDLRLAWVSADKSKFVFVNRQGQKKAEYNLEELAEKMKNGWQVVDKSAEWSPIDRSRYSSLQNIYDELDYQRCHDELTGFYNRKEFERSLENCLFKTKREESTHVLCYVDLDKFRVVNDYCGVIAGDQLLQEISREIGEALPTSAIIARVAGNEFAMLFDSCDEKHGDEYARLILQAVQSYRFQWQGQSYRLTASIGMAMLDQYIDNVVDAFRDLSSTCGLAKENGGNRIEWAKSNAEERQHRVDVLGWVARINRALDQDKLVLRCQQILPLDKGLESGSHFEVLLGVMDDDNDEVVLPPAKFIEAAERYNRMQDVDRWVAMRVFEWIKDNPRQMETVHTISINLSGNSLNDDSFIDFLSDQFYHMSVPTEKICFEVTETATISSLAKAAVFIREVKSMGCEFALDDFGTGMSSYEYLKHLPVDYLKIDGCFIKDIVNNSYDFAVVKSINEIGHFMGKKTIAEYVENKDILALLSEIGVDYAQGYGVQKPILLSSI